MGKKAFAPLYKGRIPRFILLLGTLLGIVWIIGAYFNKGPMTLDSFGSFGKFSISLVTYCLLFIVTIRANLKCHQVTCPAVFSVIFLLGYYSYPPFLKYWGYVLLLIAIYIIVKTVLAYKKTSHV